MLDIIYIEEFRQNNECNSWNYNYLLISFELSDKGSFRKVRFERNRKYKFNEQYTLL